MTDRRLLWSLLFMRISVFLVMLMWTLDKFAHPDHATKVFAHFYFIEGLDAAALRVVGVI